MKKNILCVNPWIYDFAAYDYWSKPLGLLHIAGLFLKNGHNVYLIDCLDPLNPQMVEAKKKSPKRYPYGHGKFFKEKIPKPEVLQFFPRDYYRYGMTPKVFYDYLKGIPQPHIIFVTSLMTYWYPGVFATIAILKEVFPNVPLVLGGNYVTLCPDHAKKSQADFLIQGEGEGRVALLWEQLWGEKLDFLPEESNLDSYPYGAFGLYPTVDHIPLLTSRGCPFRCIYCASPNLNSHFRRRSSKSVLEEILFWYKNTRVVNFSFYDDAFLIKPEEMALPLLTELIRLHLPLNFHCPNGLHLREITDEIAFLLYRAGFKTLRFGFETADVRRQQEMGGKVTSGDLERAAKLLKKAGYQGNDIGVYLLCGLPGQDASEVYESIQFVKACGARPILAEYSPIPGTALWEKACLYSPYPLAEEPLFHNNTLLPCLSDTFTYEHYRALKRLTKIQN